MSLNKVISIDRLGRDPEICYIPNGEAVCNFGVTTSETRNDHNGQRVERTERHNITMYRKLAEIAGQYSCKGNQVYLEGRIQSHKYQGKNGIERTAYGIIANEMKMLDSRNDNSGGASYDDGCNQGSHSNQNNCQQAPQQQYQPAPAQESPAAPACRPAPAQPTALVKDIDGDIPF